MNKPLCRALSAVYRGFCAVFHPVRIEGIERFPAEGAAILYANHTNLQDPMVLRAFLRRPMFFMAKKELFENALLSKVMTAVGAFPVARGESDLAAVRTSLSVLKDGHVLGIFPEGHRYTDGQLHEAGNGTALIALRSGAKVCPARILGSYRLFSRVTVRISEPVDLSDLGKRLDSETLNRATARMMEALKALGNEK